MSEVGLLPWEREWAEHVGTMRHEANVAKRDAEYYDPARMQDNLTASVASCCAEMAVAKLLNKYWDGSYWPAADHAKHRDQPDVGLNTEVRRIRSRGNPLPVRRRDVDAERLMVLAFPVPDKFVTVEVIGWGYAVDLWRVGVPAEYDRRGTTRLVSQDRLYAL